MPLTFHQKDHFTQHRWEAYVHAVYTMIVLDSRNFYLPWLPTLTLFPMLICSPLHCHFSHTLNITPGAKLTEEELGDLMGRLDSVTTTLKEREKAKKKAPEVTFHLPKLPDWLSSRPYLTRDFIVQPHLVPKPSGGGVVESVVLGSMPVAMQEQVILEDLLSTMMGHDGR